MEISDELSAKVGRRRNLSDSVSISDNLHVEVAQVLTQIKPKWVKIFFSIIVVVSVSSALVPHPIGIVIGIIGGSCGILLADHYRTNEIIHKVQYI